MRPGTVGAYAFAFLCAGVAAGIDPYVVGAQFPTFFAAVIITTLVSGLGAGVFCTVLSAVAAVFFVFDLRFSFDIVQSGEVVGTLLFVLLSLSNVVLVAGMRFAVEELDKQSVVLRESQERLESVVAELQHRTRNLMSVVGTIAKGTMKSSKTFDVFSATFQDRLEVLSRAQGLLFRTHEGGRVTFDELINAELAAKSVQMEQNGPVTLDGPPSR
jgi:K+-sensing histidine kinase KdpD